MTVNAVSAHPGVTPLGERVIAAMGDGALYRKADVARLVGIGRGSANRIVDHLVSSGRLSRKGSFFGLSQVKPQVSIPETLLGILANGPLHHRDLQNHFKGVKPASVSVALVRLAKQGVIRRLQRGVYEIVSESGEAYAGAGAIRAAALSFRKGALFTLNDILDICHADYVNVGNVLADMVKAGVVARVSRGVYARAGKKPASLRGKMARTEAVRQLLASEDRAWRASEVQARLEKDYPSFNAFYTLQNSWKACGNPVKVGKALWRAVRTEAPGEAASSPLPDIIRETLGKGGLWTLAEVRDAVGGEVTTGMVGLALDTLWAEGFVAHVFLGHWKARTAAVEPLSPNGRIISARLLLDAFSHWPSRLPTSETSEGYAQAKKRLIDKGYLEASSSIVCTEAFAKGLRERLRPRPPLPPLTELGHRIVKALGDRHALTRVEIAARLGIGRGSVNRMVDRLIDEGWLADMGMGRIIAI